MTSEFLSVESDHGIFYDQAKELAVDKKLILPQILGSVTAHELGHLLLGANRHSTSGLMRAVWSREELLAANLSGLHFSNSERTRIQNSVFARHQAQRLPQAQQAPNAKSSRAKRNSLSFEGLFPDCVEGRMLHPTG
jgi:hypothetical protein